MSKIEEYKEKEAPELFKQEMEGIDLVIIDIVMPRAGGREVLGEIRGLRPDVPVLLTSGYSKVFIGEGIVDGVVVHFIQKPYSMEELAREVRKVLDLKEEGS